MKPLLSVDPSEDTQSNHLEIKYLPKYAHFLLAHHLEEFTDEVLRLSHEEEVSYFKNFETLSEAEYYELNFQSNERLLQKLSEQNINEFIVAATEDYINNRLPVVDKDDILAEDIIIHSMIIRKTFRHFLKEYTKEPSYFVLVMDDVDSFMAAYNISIFKAFLLIQQKKIKTMNEDLLLAQKLSKMGSFSWNLQTGETKLTETTKTILVLDKPITVEEFYDYIQPEYRTLVKDAIDNAIKGNGTLECEFSYMKDGIEKRIFLVGLVTYLDGKPITMRGSVIDKTEEYTLIKKLKQSEELIKL